MGELQNIVEDKMTVRVQEEIDLVKKRFPDLKHEENLEWVFIPNYVLPENIYNKQTTRILFVIPVGYPDIAPDDFFADADLKLKDGNMPMNFNIGSTSSKGIKAPIEDNWGWFSWHPAENWKIKANIKDGDNLLTFMDGVEKCLKNEVFR